MLPAVLVLARHWARGRVKTRLAASVGDRRARSLYRTVAEDVWRGLEHDRLRRHLWITPAAALTEAAAWLPGSDRLHAQPEGDLGRRMAAAFDDAFASGVPWAAVAGSDAPQVDAERVLAAGAAAQGRDGAVVPSEDGGYALLALARPLPQIFSGIPWGTPEVLAHTLGAAEERGWDLAVLEPVRDLDDAEDLAWFEARGLL